MTTFSKTVVLENFKNSVSALWKEDGKSPFREYRLDEQFIPEHARYLQGDWTITVTYTPTIETGIKNDSRRID